jgi:hypothetical protein
MRSRPSQWPKCLSAKKCLYEAIPLPGCYSQVPFPHLRVTLKINQKYLLPLSGSKEAKNVL